jgi:hypothetical protein
MTCNRRGGGLGIVGSVHSLHQAVVVVVRVLLQELFLLLLLMVDLRSKPRVVGETGS